MNKPVLNLNFEDLPSSYPGIPAEVVTGLPKIDLNFPGMMGLAPTPPPASNLTAQPIDMPQAPKVNPVKPQLDLGPASFSGSDYISTTHQPEDITINPPQEVGLYAAEKMNVKDKLDNTWENEIANIRNINPKKFDEWAARTLGVASNLPTSRLSAKLWGVDFEKDPVLNYFREYYPKQVEQGGKAPYWAFWAMDPLGMGAYTLSEEVLDRTVGPLTDYALYKIGGTQLDAEIENESVFKEPRKGYRYRKISLPELWSEMGIVHNMETGNVTGEQATGQVFVDMADFAVKMVGAGGVTKGVINPVAKKIMYKTVNNVVPGGSFRLSADAFKKLPVEQQKAILEIVDREKIIDGGKQLREWRKNGIDVDVPAIFTTELALRPGWAKAKEIYGNARLVVTNKAKAVGRDVVEVLKDERGFIH